MSNDIKTSPDKFATLRKQAEALIALQERSSTDSPIDDVRKMAEEFFTYQVELELQNEELRQAQVELEQSRSKYVDLYDFAPVGYLTVSDTGMIIEANLTASDMLGVERRTLLHSPLSNFIVDDSQDVYYHHRKKIFETEGSQTCELQIRNGDGRLCHVQMKSVFSTDLTGSTKQFRTSLTDITERLNFEKSLLRSKVDWERTFDAISDIITIQDKDSRIIRANKAAHEAAQVKYGQLNGRHCCEIFGGSNEPCPNCPIPLALEAGEPRSAKINQQDIKKIFYVLCSPAYDENHNLTHIVHMARDITEQEKMTEDLFQSRKMEAIGALAGGIAHDFNNILSAIMGFSELAKERIPADSVAREDIDQVIQSSHRAANLVEQILTFSRKSDRLLESIAPHIIIKTALKLLRSSLPTTIDIQEEIEDECGKIMGDQTHIHQIILNLCTNALHAMEDEKGTLTVKLHRQDISAEEIVGESGVSAGEFIVLEVIDTGQGMDQATVEHIFEPYFTTKEVGKGTGLGLAVIHGIILDYHGFIRVESELGKGTRFYVYIPALPLEAPTADEIKETETLGPTGTERILVVDDERIIVALNKKSLERLGYKVSTTTDSRDALERIRTDPEQFDLVITDQTMPHLSGAELAKKILHIKKTMPIILCTGHSSILTEEDTLAIGIKKYAKKPVNISKLGQIVRQVLDEG